MSLLLNIIWLFLGGLVLAFEWVIAGICQCLTIIGIPLGIQNFKLAQVAFNPYKYTLR